MWRRSGARGRKIKEIKMLMFAKLSRMEEVFVRACIGFFFCFSLSSCFIQAWTSRKCVLAQGPFTLYNLPYCNLVRTFEDKEARCGNVSNFDNDFSDLPGDVLALCVTGSVQTIPKNALYRFQKLLYLSLAIPVKTVQSGAFRGLQNLQNLSISFYPLTYKCNNKSLAQDVFLGLTSLKTLIIANVCVKYIKQIFLSPSSQLQKLSLEEDNIDDISTVFRIFRGMKSVQRLSVRFNDITIVQLELDLDQWHAMPTVFELDLSGNSVTNVSPGTFNRMGLHSLILSPCPAALSDLLYSGAVTLDHLLIGSVHKGTTKVLKSCCSIASKFNLTSFSLIYSHIGNISGDALSMCWSLEKFDLSNNNLQYLESDLLHRIPHLAFLDLSSNYELKLDLCPSLYKQIHFHSGLRVLRFSYNNTTMVKNKQFSCMPYLEELDLSGNHIERIDPLGFWGLLQLKYLVLRANKLKEITSRMLSHVPKLLSLDINTNEFRVFKGGEIGGLNCLQELTLGSERMFFIPENLPQLNILTFNSGSDIRIISDSGIAMSSVKIMTLDAFSIFIKALNISLFHNIRELNIHFNGDIVFNDLPVSFYQLCPRLEKLFYSHFLAGQHYSALNFSGLSYLNTLEVWNLFSALEEPTANPEFIFQNLPSLKFLKLQNSGLKYLTRGMFRSMVSLQVFVLCNDAIATLENGIQGPFHNLQSLYLDEVTFPCDCVNEWFYSWAVSTQQTFVTNLNNVICLQQRTKHNFLDFLKKGCKQSIEFVLFLLTSLFLMAFLSVTLLYHTCGSFPLNVKYIFHAWLNRLRGRRRGAVRYEYDVFVSYSSWDQDWILQHLIPNLEEKGPPFLKLCLHNRDFEVGKDIVDNIGDSIYRSRKTICVISHNYLRSDWCSLEMRMATYRLIAEQEDVLILLFLENISKYQLSAYHRLAKMVKKKTYIDWPDDSIEEQMAFWERLRKAIGKDDNEEDTVRNI
ncbi:toll-like receptor 11 [Ambystoma mexicanum]|uniref:toll-like receptor 11 n=1 Tax=Ambystoma mexicanum TaxID=8296 RepID=UPI0037E7F5B1